MYYKISFESKVVAMPELMIKLAITTCKQLVQQAKRKKAYFI
jgi:hypothetical protein